MSVHPRHARVNPNAPEAWGVCDRCGMVHNLVNLAWQYDWRGNQLMNIRLLVCTRCTDKPFEHNRPIVLPPDPPPKLNARPEQYDIEEA